VPCLTVSWLALSPSFLSRLRYVVHNSIVNLLLTVVGYIYNE